MVVAKVEARIVQRAIHDVLISIPVIQAYIKTPYSFGGVKKLKSEEIAAVPAAIHAVLEAIGNGADFIIRSDITSFFTRIPKSTVTKIVANAVSDNEFLTLFEQAIAVELENMAQLRGHAKAFPIEDIGVAQGNSLSPLLGNLILYDFDRELNKKPDVRCIRYIDDFIILAPSKEIAENTFSKAKHLLAKHNMSVSEAKTQRAQIKHGFEFLGIDVSNGLLRPGKKSQRRMIESVKATLHESRKAMRAHKAPEGFHPSKSLLSSLRKISGIMQGWGKHYRFCNDVECLRRLDGEVTILLREYLAAYRQEREKANDADRWKLLGVESLAAMELTSFFGQNVRRSRH